MINFEYECWAPIGNVRVNADEHGKHLLIISEETGGTIQPQRLRPIDCQGILQTVEEWVDHYVQMRKKEKELRPENESFGINYVEGLNKDMNE